MFARCALATGTMGAEDSAALFSAASLRAQEVSNDPGRNARIMLAQRTYTRLNGFTGEHLLRSRVQREPIDTRISLRLRRFRRKSALIAPDSAQQCFQDRHHNGLAQGAAPDLPDLPIELERSTGDNLCLPVTRHLVPRVKYGPINLVHLCWPPEREERLPSAVQKTAPR